MTEFDRLRAVAAGQLAVLHQSSGQQGWADEPRASERSPQPHPRSCGSPHLPKRVDTTHHARRSHGLDPGHRRTVLGVGADSSCVAQVRRLSAGAPVPCHRAAWRFLDRVGAAIHTTRDLPMIDRESIGRLPVLSPTRTMIDLAGHVNSVALTAALDGAIRDGLTDENHLLRRIHELRGRGRHGLPKLVDVISGSEITRGGHSWLEREFLAVSNRAGLPQPLTQQVLSRAKDRLVRVDCRYPGTRVVVELLGYRWHRTREHLRRDIERMNALVLDGFLPLQCTTAQLIEEPEWILGAIRIALASASAA